MPALSDTVLQDAILLTKRGFGDYEGRLSNYGALSSFIDGANKLMPASQVESLKKSPAQPEKIPMLNKYNATILNARSCNIVCNDRVSAFKTLSYITRGFTICVADAINAGNYISAAEDFAWQMKQGLRAALNSLDIAAVNALETNKNTALVDSNLPSITNTAASYEENVINDLYFDIPTLMKLNDLDADKYANVMNTEALKTALYYESFGANNQQNLNGVLNGALGAASRYEHYTTNNIALGTAFREIHYVFPEDAVGLFVWNPFDYINKSRTSDGKRWFTMQDPIFGITWGVLEESTCMDMSATYPGQTAVAGTKYSFTADFSFLTAYASDGAGPIVKFVNRKVPVSS